MYFDTHAHFDSEKFEADRLDVLSAMPAAGVELILDPGSDLATSRTAAALAEQFDYVYAAAGVHPHEAEDVSDSYMAAIEELCRLPKVKAIGEIGLDYHYDFSPRQTQREVFAAQMALARDLDMPVIIHDREAHEDFLNIMRQFPTVRGVVHCYSGSLEMTRDILKAGWNISFTGSVTFKNNKKAPGILAAMPADRYMIETDSPYMTPVPHRGKRNDSSYLKYIAEFIAGIRWETPEEVAAQTLENGKRFFGID
ncbi:MAG: TatD family hydrolase [Clostridiales bacterium]|nr:TatD family hydrolase [Clostridiales bacterium]